MYSKEDLLRVLRKNLKSELDVIAFYVDNAPDLNYSVNKEKVDTLIFDSFQHAKWLTEEILKLDAEGVTLSEQVREQAFKEETGVKEIYKYELNRTDIEEVKIILKKLIEEEERHEEIVKSLR